MRGKREKINYPVNIKAIYYVSSRRKIDITNLHACLHDILVDYGILENDNAKIVIGTDDSRVRYDKEDLRTEVEITPAGEEDIEEAKLLSVTKTEKKRKEEGE